MLMKTCKKCKRSLELNKDNYYSNAKGSFFAICKQCDRQRKRMLRDKGRWPKNKLNRRRPSVSVLRNKYDRIFTKLESLNIDYCKVTAGEVDEIIEKSNIS